MSHLEEICCPICKSQDYKILQKAAYPDSLSSEEYLEVYKSSSDTKLMDQLVECSGCGLVYLNPRVKSDIILQSYSEAIDSRFITQNKSRIRTFKKVFKRWLKKEKILPSSNYKVLDIGCAGGAFPKAVNDLGFQVVGVEPSRFLCDFGRKEYGLDIRSGTLHEQQFKDNEFDIVSMWDVIEHLDQPESVLKEIFRILRSGGWLIINYPEYNSWPRKILGMNWPFFLNVHLYYFNPKTICQLLEKQKYHTKRIEPYFQTLELGYVFERAGAIFPLFKWLEKLVKVVGLGNTNFTYYIGQTLVTAKKEY